MDIPPSDKTRYTIRLDESQTVNSQSVVLFCQRQPTTIKRIILAKEGNGTTLKFHYHLYFEYNQNHELGSLQKMVARSFDNRGTSKAVAKMKKTSYPTYCVKDKQILYSRGYSKEELSDLQARSYKKKSKVSNPVDDIYQIVKANGTTCEYEIQNQVYSYFLGKDKGMQYHYMRAIVKQIYGRQNPEEGREDFNNFCSK